jgi:hypothetical protein
MQKVLFIFSRRRFVIATGFFCLIIAVLLWIHDVPKTPTEKDTSAILAIYPITFVNAEHLNFEQQIELIRAFQSSLHAAYSIGEPIDYYKPREPNDLIQNKEGRCYDFSRTIEKFLMLNNLKVRHVAVYQVNSEEGKWKSFLRPHGVSHSLTEVKTAKGWMIVDSNFEWIGIDKSGDPKSFFDICSAEQRSKKINWRYEVVRGYEPFFSCCPIYIYGLYSRHGCFYPPYNLIPDYNLKDLVYYNLLGWF